MIANKNTNGSAFAKSAQQAKAIERQLVADLMGGKLGLTFEQAVGVVANLAHESKAGSASYGFSAYNEENPTVPGSRGGAGWAQWTASRRNAFEDWAEQNNLPLDSYAANFGFMEHELTGSHAKALAAIKSAATIDEAVKATMTKYEKPGIPHAVSRYQMADKIAAPIVSEMQKSLAELGMYEGPIDGIMGPQTAAALGDYNMANGGLSPSAAISSLSPSLRDSTRTMEEQSMAQMGDYLDNRSFRQTELDSMRTMGLQGLMPSMASAPGGLFDFAREAAAMQPGFDQQEAGNNLAASLSMDMSGTGPGAPPANNLADAYNQAQYQPASGNPWQGENAPNFASPSPYTRDQQRIADQVRQSVAPQVTSAPGGLFNPYDMEQGGIGIGPQAGLSAPAMPAQSGAQQWAAAREAAGVPSRNTTGANAWETARTQAYPETPRSYPSTAPAQSPAAALAAAYGAAQYAPAQNELGQLAAGTPMMPSTASSATQSNPVAPPATVAPRQAAPAYSSPSRNVPSRNVTEYAPAPTITPAEAAKFNMSETVPGMYMPNVAGNPARVAADQLGLFARNPASIFTAALGALQGGVFFDRLLPDLAVANGGLFGSVRASAPTSSRQSIGGGLTAPGGDGGRGGFGGIGGLGGNFNSTRGSDGGFNSGYTSSSGFTYDR